MNDYFYYGALVLGTLLVAIVLSIVFNRLMKLFITKYSERLKVNPTNFSFLKNSVSFIIFSVALIFIFLKIPYLRSLGTGLFAGAGIMVVIVGFASQKAFSNIISGIFILIFKPFSVNDMIEFLDGTRGIVEEITLRHTVIRNFENRRIIIPNGNISEDTIINSTITDSKIRRHITYGISYDSNIDKAVSIIQEESMKHPNFIDNRTAKEKQDNVPPVLVRLIALADFSVQLKAYVWSNTNAESFALQCDVMKSVFDRFNNEGIEVPFPYRTIVYKKDIEAQKTIES
jgi:small-conductance mechanosensitive channel